MEILHLLLNLLSYLMISIKGTEQDCLAMAAILVQILFNTIQLH